MRGLEPFGAMRHETLPPRVVDPSHVLTLDRLLESFTLQPARRARDMAGGGKAASHLEELTCAMRQAHLGQVRA